MPDDAYTLADLARLADVTPRTVRYYVAQGLLPSPDAAGPATRYGEGHLARLRLIRRMQRDHLPLAEIRARLLALTDDEILASADVTAAERVEPTAALDFVHELMARDGITPSLASHAVAESAPPYHASLLQRIEVPPAPGPAPSTAAPAAEPAAPSRSEPPFAPWGPSVPASAAAAPSVLAASIEDAKPPSRSTQPDRSSWERLVITPDVELHVRRPLDRRTNRRVDQLERIARELLGDDV
jgi:DNA-binding transcriptional MerR regulator